MFPRLLTFLVAIPAFSVCASSNVHITYHWHLHQPIYWPEKVPWLNRYQFGAESVDLKNSPGGQYYPGDPYNHPRNALAGEPGEFDEVFTKADRVIAYQHGGKDSIATLGGHPDGGASVSYSGALIENIGSFGRASRIGYHPGWADGYRTARGWLTSGGKPKADMTGINYHHSFSPLLPRSVLRKEIQIFREIWWKTWNGNPDKSDHSRGYWPIEAAFSETMIPVLVSEGYDWAIIANSHLARTCANYLEVAQKGNSGWNIDPPNKADAIGPVVPASQWWNGTLDGRGGAFPAPFAYQPHKAKYVDPATGAETKITVVPMCDLLSYQNGFGTMGTGDIDAHIAPFNDPARPSLVLMAHDGDNAWGGGNSYYQESVPNFANAAAGQGYRPTTIQQYLAEHPVPENDVVHVEDGAWFNAANDWGHPQFINWLYPPTRAPSDPAYVSTDPRTWFDLETPGWTEDWRNWAVLMAGANFCETAEQITIGNGGSVATWKIQEPTQPNGTNNQPNAAEQAWHYFLGGLDSGFMYYGTSLDDEQKQALATNRAISHATQVVGNGAQDQTPPTIFKPQRFPWNPGGMGWGPLTGYREIGFNGKAPYASDFHIWTLAFDVSGIPQTPTLYVRESLTGTNPLSNNENETYAGGATVGPWVALPMTKRAVPTGNVTNNPQVNFFELPSHIADHYWARVTGYRNKLLDYYIEAADAKGNSTRTDIQHVWVGDDGTPGTTPTPTPTPTATPSPTPSAGGGFVMDGQPDSPGFLLSSPGMTIYAAVRGTKLYLSTWSPGNSGGSNDHFLFVADVLLPAASGAAPWAKAGTVSVAAGKPFLAGESMSGYAGWTNAPATAVLFKAAGNGGQLEGVIDLEAAFGSVPPMIYLASAAYGTANGGALAAQAPTTDGNGNIEPNEFLAVPVAAIRDENSDGRFDRLDPALAFRASLAPQSGGSGFLVSWPAVPGRSYQIRYRNALSDSWQNLPGGLVMAPSGADVLSHLDAAAATQRFYIIESSNP